jgi:PEP-CTERM motif
MRTPKFALVIALGLLALLAPRAAQADDVTYAVDQTIGPGTVTGTIVTDGTIGVLSASDIVGGSLTITGYGTSQVADLPADILDISGDDLSATDENLLFNFSGTDKGGVAFGPSPIGPYLYWNLGTTGYPLGVALDNYYPGENIVNSAGLSHPAYTVALSGSQVVATVVNSPEPETSSLILIGLGSLGFLTVRRRRKALGLPQAA